jgi:hypothetical protein
LLAAPNVSLAGQPSRVGGVAATIFGLFVLVMGLSLSAAVFFLLQSIWPESVVGWAFSLPMAAGSAFFGTLLLLGGRSLRRSGTAKREKVQLEAVRAMVEHRKGPVNALEVAKALDLPEPEVDALLMRLAREHATDVTVDVDQQGHVVYDFEGEQRRWRVLEEQADAEAPADEGEAEAARLKRH